MSVRIEIEPAHRTTTNLPDDEVVYSNLQEALDANNISIPLAPRWIPKDYSLQQLDVRVVDDNPGFFATYMSGEDLRIIFSAVKRPGTNFSTVEKTNDDAQEYRDGGIDHYIMENTSCIQAVWINEDFECMIAGNGISSKQLEQIINSLYKYRAVVTFWAGEDGVGEEKTYTTPSV